MNDEKNRRGLFKAAFYANNRHLQTILPTLFTYPLPPLNWQILPIADGDHVELAWVNAPSPLTQVIIILLPGLEGSIASHYISRLLARLQHTNLTTVVLHHRGCGPTMNRLWRSYHSNDQLGLQALVRHCQTRWPTTPLYAIGYSMGANLLANYLADHPLNGAALICPPLNLAVSAALLNQPTRLIYRRYLLNSLKQRLSTKIAQFANAPIKRSTLKSIHTLAEFDECYTAPACGFNSANDYYQQASCLPRLALIDTPTWLLRAADDPVVDPAPEDLTQRLSPSIHYQLSRHGGHVGFSQGWRLQHSWLDETLLRWLQRSISPTIEKD
ncbi:YheT family hydrolase [Celerinatantimonas yamalensis]|uniref:Alpha/beta fold hydrolase n=1 Tax=Celerinatantimonas yamalensis TaxID=559956 RepID=A0ABW9GA12_9GAMM